MLHDEPSTHHHNLCPSLSQVQIQGRRVLPSLQLREAHALVCQRGTIPPWRKRTLVVEAEEVKRELADQLSGRVVEPVSTTERDIRSAVNVFVAEKRVEGLTSDLIKKYTLWLGRLVSFCEGHGGFTLRAIDRELLIAFCTNWETQYPSSLTRSKLLERYKSFLRFCVEAGWLATVPKWPKIQLQTTPTMPLTMNEYNRLLDAV